MSSDTSSRALRRPHAFGPLYDLLCEHFPDYRGKQNLFDVPGFAKALGYTHETVYRAIRPNGLLKTGVALRVIKLSRENQASKPLHWDDLLDFVLPEFDSYRLDAAGDENDISDLSDLLD